MTLWNVLKEREGSVLRTLDHRKEFDLLAVAKRELVVSPRASGEERTILRSEIEAGFLLVAERGELSLQEFGKDQGSVNGSYVFALLLEYSSIQMRRRPLRLKYIPYGGPSLSKGRFDVSEMRDFRTIEVEEGIEQQAFWTDPDELDQS